MSASQTKGVADLIRDGWTFEDAYEMIVGSDKCNCEDYPCCGH